MVQTVRLIDAESTQHSDYDLTQTLYHLIGRQWGVHFSNANRTELAYSAGNIAPGIASVVCTRATSSPIANQKFLAVFYSDTNVPVVAAANRKIYIEIDETLINSPALISDVSPAIDYALGLNIGSIKSTTSYPTHSNYLKLYEFDASGNPIDVRREVMIDSWNLDLYNYTGLLSAASLNLNWVNVWQELTQDFVAFSANYSLASSAFSTLTLTGATVTTNAGVDPLGTSTASRLTESATSAVHTWTVNAGTSSGAYTFTIFLKAAGRNFVTVGFWDLTVATQNMVVDLSTGAIVSLGSWITASIQSVWNGRYRCSVTRTVATASINPGIALRTNYLSSVSQTYTGDGTSWVLFFWGVLDCKVKALRYTGTGWHTLTLPTASSTNIGAEFTIKNAWTGSITIDGGGNVDWASYTQDAGCWIRLKSDWTTWRILWTHIVGVAPLQSISVWGVRAPAWFTLAAQWSWATSQNLQQSTIATTSPVNWTPKTISGFMTLRLTGDWSAFVWVHYVYTVATNTFIWRIDETAFTTGWLTIDGTSTRWTSSSNGARPLVLVAWNYIELITQYDDSSWSSTRRWRLRIFIDNVTATWFRRNARLYNIASSWWSPLYTADIQIAYDAH